MPDNKTTATAADMRHPMRKAITAALAAAVISSFVTFYLSIDNDHIYNFFSRTPLTHGNYIITSAENSYFCGGHTVSLKSVTETNGSVKAIISVENQSAKETVIDSSDLNIFITDINLGKESVKCTVRSMSSVAIPPSASADIPIYVDQMPQLSDDGYMLAVAVQIPNCHETVEFLYTTNNQPPI